MSTATSLMQALLGSGTTAAVARRALDEALLYEVDPVHWVAAHLGLPEAEIMRRAASWTGLSFFDNVPRLSQSVLAPSRLETLAQVRLYRIRVTDRAVVFAAPDFSGILRLRAALQNRPDLAGSLCFVPLPALRDFLVEQAGGALVDGARQNMARRWPHAAAQLELTGITRHFFVLLLVLLTLILLAAPISGHGGLIPFWLVLVLVPAVLRIAALSVPVRDDAPLESNADPSALPTYSVLVPLRHEANMVDQLVTALSRLDYPAEKLEIIFVVEGASPATVRAVRQYLDDARFSLLVVPDAPPRTKPKALAFALPLCRGDLLVVYDAEDRPEPDQLRRVAAAFERRPDLACIQARLVIDNGGQSLLPSLFAGEYAGLFGVLLPALAQWGLVMPLGGTSNHFRIGTLRALGGWDSFNVTEDADLGVRLARRKLRCATISSQTYEAAPTRLLPWMGQRTRWMKGWMQTYVVHNRRMKDLIGDMGWGGTLMFQAVLLGMLLAPLLHAGFLMVLLLHVVTGQLAWPVAQPWPIACLIVLIAGHASAIAINLVGLARTGQGRLWLWQALVPVYWLLIALATLRALREFAQRPFHWFKSPHSVTRPPSVETPKTSREAAYPAGNIAQRLGRKAIWDRSTAG